MKKFDTFKPEHILCPCNITDAAETTLKYAVSLAKGFHSRLTVLYCHENDKETDFAEIRKELGNWIKKTVGKDFDRGIFYGRTTDLVVRNVQVPVLVTPYFT